MTSMLLNRTEEVLTLALDDTARRLGRPTEPVAESAPTDDSVWRLLARRWSGGRDARPTDARLRSVFSRVGSGDGAQGVFARRPLRLERVAVFAGPADSVVDDEPGLRKAIEDALRRRPSNLQDRIEHQLETLRTVSGCLPATVSNQTLSVYDQARMEAALAACLTAIPSDLLHAWERGDRLNEPTALLVGGDLSGIQAFLYTLSSKRAAKTLRGRSFYLQLLTEAVLRLVLRELGLSTANVIYSGGGHFYLLAPVNAESKLNETKQAITRILWNHHGAALYFALGWAPVTAGQLSPASPTQGDDPTASLRGAWHAMHAQLHRAKQRRYGELGDSLYENVFGVREHGGNAEQVCAVCGEERARTKALDDPDDPIDAVRVCPHCESLATELGAPLASANRIYLSLGSADVERPAGTAFDTLSALGLTVSFEAAPIGERSVIWAFTDDSRENLLQTHATMPVLRRYTVDIPQSQALREFSQLVNKTEGISRLGVLRADVDDLGAMFRDLSGSETTALTMLAALSSALSLFFEGWVTRLARDIVDEDGNRLVYGVYSGGDDLFLIGPWDRMPDLAQAIAMDFATYSHGRAHLSAGLALVEEKYPVYQAAADAAAALDDAKDQTGKNSFSFLGRAYPWASFAQIDAHRTNLAAIVGSDTGRRALLQTLRQLGLASAEARRKDGKLVIGPWLWRGVYQLRRFAESDKATAKRVEGVIVDLQADEYSAIEDLGMAARWQQLLLRD